MGVLLRLVCSQAILVAICLSSICLVLDSPRNDPESDLAHTLRRLDVFFTSLFLVEMATKVIAVGFVCGEGAYLRNLWNQVPCQVV